MRALIERLMKLDASALCDANKNLRVMGSHIRPISKNATLVGPARIVRTDGDFFAVLDALHAAVAGEVLVVDASQAIGAVAGELFASEAKRKGLAGIVIDGLCRDTRTLARLDFPFYASGSCPMAGSVNQLPEKLGAVKCGGVEVISGELIVGDRDGLIILSEGEAAEAVSKAEEIVRAEDKILAEIKKGRSLFDFLNFDVHKRAIGSGADSRLQFKLG